MRQTAERAVSSKCGKNLKFGILGNSPLSFYKYKYPKQFQIKTEKVGAKVFIFKAYLTSEFFDDATVEGGENVLDYQWATLEEMKTSLEPDTFRAVTRMLHSED